MLFSIMAISVYISTNSVPGFHFLHVLTNIYYLWFFADSHSDRCEMITHCGSDLHFRWLAILSIFFMCLSSLEKFLFRSTVHFQLFFFYIDLYELFMFWILTLWWSLHL